MFDDYYVDVNYWDTKISLKKPQRILIVRSYIASNHIPVHTCYLWWCVYVCEHVKELFSQLLDIKDHFSILQCGRLVEWAFREIFEFNFLSLLILAIFYLECILGYPSILRTTLNCSSGSIYRIIDNIWIMESICSVSGSLMLL